MSQQQGEESSQDVDLSDLECLNFPGDIDWSSTLVIRCDPTAGPYKLDDVTKAFHEAVRRNEVFTLGTTILNHAFTLSFRYTSSMENFVNFMTNRRSKRVLVKGKPCILSKIPNKCVTVSVRHVPIEIDTAHVVGVLKTWGTIVKTELVKSRARGWLHVYTNERKFQLLLNEGLTPQDLPFSIDVKGIIGAVSVEERNPKCLECFYSGHRSNSCELRGCILNK